MEPKETADSNISPKNIVHFEKMMSYGSVSSVFDSLVRWRRGERKERAILLLPPPAQGASATCSPEFHIKAVFNNKLTDENTISLSTVLNPIAHVFASPLLLLLLLPAAASSFFFHRRKSAAEGRGETSWNGKVDPTCQRMCNDRHQHITSIHRFLSFLKYVFFKKKLCNRCISIYN